MRRIPRNTLSEFEQLTGIKAKYISAYLSSKSPIKPSGKRCLVLSKASRDLGYDFTEADWMFQPQKIRKSLIDKERSPA